MFATPPSPPGSPRPRSERTLMTGEESSKLRREILNAWSTLRSMGLTQVLNLPQIALIGSQSSGKSSLIEALCQIKLPRSIGTCTRCPIECRVSYAEGPWTARVFLMVAEQDDNNRARWREEVPFGDSLHDPDELEERIAQAQRAVLHPRVDPTQFLNEDIQSLEAGLTFTKNRVIVKVSGDTLSDLSFVDLPGIIANTSDQNVGDIELVQKLISSYMRKKSTINLIVITCESDFETQVAGRLAKSYDPNGGRTIGVLTKVDRIEPNQERQWIPLIKEESHPLANGWFAVKQPTTSEREEGRTWEEARANEVEYFTTEPGWSSIPTLYRRNLGTKHLASKLGQVLFTEMQKCFPALRLEVDRLIKANDLELSRLPERPQLGSRDLLQQLVTQFVNDAEKQLIKGSPSAGMDGVVQDIREKLNELREELQQAAPVFLPADGKSSNAQLPRPAFLPSDEVWLTRSPCGNEYTTTEVAKYAVGARTREWPGHYPFQVMLDYTEQFVQRWGVPVNQCFYQINSRFERRLLDLVNEHFAAYSCGGLLDLVKKIVMEIVGRCKTITEKELAKYELQFADYYREFFDSTRGLNQLAQALETITPELRDAISVLEKLGLPSLDPGQWRAVNPVNKQDRSVLRIISSVRAHCQVAFKRFSDKVKDAVNQSYVYAFNDDLENELRRGLQLNSSEASDQYFDELTKESEAAEMTRNILKDKSEKLHAAKMKLA